MTRNIRCFSLPFAAALLSTAVVALAAPREAAAQTIPYHGELFVDGAPANGTFPMSFQVMSQLLGFFELEETFARDVVVVNGEFDALLGPLPDWALNDEFLRLRVSVDGVALAGEQRIYPSYASEHAEEVTNIFKTVSCANEGSSADPRYVCDCGDGWVAVSATGDCGDDGETNFVQIAGSRESSSDPSRLNFACSSAKLSVTTTRTTLSLLGASTSVTYVSAVSMSGDRIPADSTVRGICAREGTF
ncbi:MAG: hypothetical protein H6698_04425 [Myxococcales bacterium]|nr:hypothetical protein [Myxococcales bacterium]MCB9520252.1 hypothetical protein [Myxococcales bacterium]MCB9531380.1 hypothetical protein [Myxococcales bacterium]MCB9533547.1 hypothetical protein [Myxococcales bacterium]